MPHSLPKFWVKFLIPAFAAEYAKALESAGSAEADDMFIIVPFLFFNICLPKTWQPK